MTDDTLIEAMSRAMFKPDQINRLDIAKAALAVCRPIIEAQERERCIRIVEMNTREIDYIKIAAALKETDNGPV